MTIFDLLFIIVVLASVAALTAVVASALRGRLRQAVKLLAMYGVCLAFYLGVIVVVSLASPQRILALGESRCFYGWCVAVEDVTLARELGQGERSVLRDHASTLEPCPRTGSARQQRGCASGGWPGTDV